MGLPEGLVRTADGFVVLRDDTHLSRWVEDRGRLDIGRAEIDRFRQYIPEGGTVIDAGACIGDHTIVYAEYVGTTGHVYAFEPYLLAAQACFLNTAHLPQVTVLNAALGSRAREGCLYLNPNKGASFLSDTGSAWAAQETPTQPLPTLTVPVTTLDDALLPVVSRCDYLHLDAEGWEPFILAGGADLIRRFRPVLVFEMSQPHLERAGMTVTGVWVLLAALGYVVELPPNGVFREEQNVLALPREKISAPV